MTIQRQQTLRLFRLPIASIVTFLIIIFEAFAVETCRWNLSKKYIFPLTFNFR